MINITLLLCTFIIYIPFITQYNAAHNNNKTRNRKIEKKNEIVQITENQTNILLQFTSAIVFEKEKFLL